MLLVLSNSVGKTFKAQQWISLILLREDRLVLVYALQLINSTSTRGAVQADRSTKQWSLPCSWFPTALKGGHKELLLQCGEVLVAQPLSKGSTGRSTLPQTLQDLTTPRWNLQPNVPHHNSQEHTALDKNAGRAWRALY